MRRIAVPIPPIVIAVAIAAAAYEWAVVATTPAWPGRIGLNLNALGTDWMVFYSGARYFFEGQLAALFDGEAFTAHLNAAFAGWLSMPMPRRPWVYPPSYLLAMLPFGMLPFAASYVAFQAISALLLAIALGWRPSPAPSPPTGEGCGRGDRAASPRHAGQLVTHPDPARIAARPLVLAAALLGPAAAINFGMGQNAFLMAALLVAGLRLVAARPALAGILFGLLTMKPQFWLLVPVALVAGRHWRSLLWSIAAAAGLACLSAAVFGLDTWHHWIDLARGSYADPHGEWMVFGRLWGNSVYACVVAAGLSATVADVAQAAAIAAAAALAYAAFRLKLAQDRRIVVVLVGALLAAPHCSLADLVLVATAAALWAGEAATQGGKLAQWTLALAVWLAPLFNPPLVSPAGRLTPLLLLGFATMAMMPALAAQLPRASLLPALRNRSRMSQ